MSDGAVTILKRLNMLLRSGAQWTKFVSFAREDGSAVTLKQLQSGGHPEVKRYCLSGAMLQAAIDAGEKVEPGDTTLAQLALATAVKRLYRGRLKKGRSVTQTFNDHVKTNFGEVRIAIKEAILIAKEQE